jgi:hypothetical protein
LVLADQSAQDPPPPDSRHRKVGLWTCTSDELYDLLVVQRGWSLPRYARFLADFMITALLPPAR